MDAVVAPLIRAVGTLKWTCIESWKASILNELNHDLFSLFVVTRKEKGVFDCSSDIFI